MLAYTWALCSEDNWLVASCRAINLHTSGDKYISQYNIRIRGDTPHPPSVIMDISAQGFWTLLTWTSLLAQRDHFAVDRSCISSRDLIGLGRSTFDHHWNSQHILWTAWEPLVLLERFERNFDLTNKNAKMFSSQKKLQEFRNEQKESAFGLEPFCILFLKPVMLRISEIASMKSNSSVTTFVFFSKPWFSCLRSNKQVQC